MASIQTISFIASDLGLFRIKDESESDFACRTLYSAARGWVHAFCLDDGADGTVGASRQAISRRLKEWLVRAAPIAYGVKEWFEVDDGGVRSIYERLIDVGDIGPSKTEGRFVALRESQVPIVGNLGLRLGYSPISPDNKSCVLSGLLYVERDCLGHVAASVKYPPWGHFQQLLSFEKAPSFDFFEYANYDSNKWSLSSNEVWCSRPTFVDGLSLARVREDGLYAHQFVLVKGSTRNVQYAEIDRDIAYRFFFSAKRVTGNPVSVAVKLLDENHFEAFLPLGMVPGEVGRYLNAMSWPRDCVSDNCNRIMRREALGLMRALLDYANVEVRSFE